MTSIAACRPASFVLLVAVAAPLAAQDNRPGAATTSPEAALLSQEVYVRPPADVERLVTAPRHLNVTLSTQSPNRRYFVKLQSEGMPTVQQFGKPWYNLGGLQIDPKGNRARTLTTRAGTGLEVIDATTGKSTTIEVPPGATVSAARWSPDGTQLAYMANFVDATHVYVADIATLKSRRVTTTPVLAVLVTEPEWTSRGNEIVVVAIPDNRGPEPKEPVIATGPKVRMTKPGAPNRTPTYADLLQWPFERDLLEYYTTGQLTAINVRTRVARKIGAPAMIQRVDAAPSGVYFRIAAMQKPFSYQVPVSAFGSLEQIWDASGKAVLEIARRPLREGRSPDDDSAGGAPPAANDTSKRNVQWAASGDAIYFLQSDPPPPSQPAAGAGEETPAGQGGGGRRTRDRLVQWNAPFDSAGRKTLLENANRMSEAAFSADGKTVFIAENVNGTAHVFAADLTEPAKHYTLTRVRGLTASLGLGGGGFGGGGGGPRGGRGADSITFYQNPGTLMSDRTGEGTPTVLTSVDGKVAYLSGTQYYRAFADSAPQPFVDRIEIRTGQKSRVFMSAGDVFERVTAALDPDLNSVIVVREGPTTVPDAYRKDLKTGALTKLTSNRDYTPEVTFAQKKMFQVARADGYKFWVSVTLPRDWKEGTRLPGFIWFYPYEYTNQGEYDRTKRTYNRNSFPSMGALSKQYLVTQGYALVEPDAPIVGETNRMNDNYVPDLRNNLAAVIDELDRRALVDRSRLGIGGHSYGAFSTVNALVNTPFFKAGIAGDGNYNRTLTPNQFQSERRTLWEARDTYLQMSPLLWADRMNGALLMYHGLEDQNTGTDPINSVRLFHALQGMGKPAALYMYPYEDHGPATKETALDLWARWIAWLDKYVKGTGGKVAADD